MPSHLFGASDPEAKKDRDAKRDAARASRDKAKADNSR